MTAEKPKLTALFQPQADMPGNRIQDIDGAVTIEMTKWFLRQDLPVVRSIMRESAKSHGKDLDLIAEASDVLLRRHNGPYEVRLDIEEIEAFLEAAGADAASLDQATLERLRKEFHVLGYEIPHPADEDMFLGPQPGVPVPGAPSLELELLDWHIQDGAADELSDSQRKPWKMVVAPGGWGATIEFIAPDGTRRSVGIELNLGNPKLTTFTSGNEVDAIVTLGREATHVTASVSIPGASIKGVLIDNEGIRKAPEEAEPDFADPEAGPSPR